MGSVRDNPVYRSLYGSASRISLFSPLVREANDYTAMWRMTASSVALKTSLKSMNAGVLSASIAGQRGW
jgi:hypothetical protein